jgi:hypothetical protein
MSSSSGFATEPYILNSYTIRRTNGGVILHTPYEQPTLCVDQGVPLSLFIHTLTVPINEVEPMLVSSAPSALQISKFQKTLQASSLSLLAHIAYPQETVLKPPTQKTQKFQHNKEHDFISSFKAFAETRDDTSTNTHRIRSISTSQQVENIPDVMLFPLTSSDYTRASLSYKFLDGSKALAPNEFGIQKATDIALLKMARNNGRAYSDDDVASFRNYYSNIAYKATEAAMLKESEESNTLASKSRKFAAQMKKLRNNETKENKNHSHLSYEINSLKKNNMTSITKDVKNLRLASREVLFTPASQGALAELRAFRCGLQELESRRRRFNAVLGRDPSALEQNNKSVNDPRISPFVF